MHELRVDNLWKHPLACIEGPTLPPRANSEIGAGAAGNDTDNDISGSIPYDIQNPRDAVDRTFPDRVLTQPPRAGLVPSNSSAPQSLTKLLQQCHN